MSQWKNTDDAANSVNWVAESINAGSGKANIAANNTALFVNTTPSSFPSQGHQVIGQFGVTKAAKANTSGESGKVSSVGWTIRREGMGPLVGVTIANGGTGYANGGIISFTGATGESNSSAIISTDGNGMILTVSVTVPGLFANVSAAAVVAPSNSIASAIVGANAGLGFTTGDIVKFSNATANAFATITANAAGNGAVTALAVTVGGHGFVNVSDTVESWLAANGSPTGNGIGSVTVSVYGGLYNNTDVVTFSNGTVNAVGNPTTNATGNITSVTITSVGAGFANVSDTVVTITAANGSASLGSGATLVPVISVLTVTPTLGGGSGANLIPVFGGRAGRVTYETIVASGSIAAGAGSNTAQLPQ